MNPEPHSWPPPKAEILLPEYAEMRLEACAQNFCQLFKLPPEAKENFKRVQRELINMVCEQLQNKITKLGASKPKPKRVRKTKWEK
jgi:hypothetical protein